MPIICLIARFMMRYGYLERSAYPIIYQSGLDDYFLTIASIKPRLTMKQMYKVSTIECLYCRDSTALLAELLCHQNKLKTIITYGINSYFTPSINDRQFRVINISRHGKEYKGFINCYTEVQR